MAEGVSDAGQESVSRGESSDCTTDRRPRKIPKERLRFFLNARPDAYSIVTKERSVETSYLLFPIWVDRVSTISPQIYPLRFNKVRADGGGSFVLIVVSPDQPRPIVAVTEGSMLRSPFC